MTVFDEAEALVNGDRQEEYGPPAENLAATAAAWTAILKTPVTAQQVCLCMAGLKLVRAGHMAARDSIVDACGYLRLHEMCAKTLHERCEACHAPAGATRCGRANYFYGEHFVDAGCEHGLPGNDPGDRERAEPTAPAEPAEPADRCYTCKSTDATRCGRFADDYAYPAYRTQPCKMGRVRA